MPEGRIEEGEKVLRLEKCPPLWPAIEIVIAISGRSALVPLQVPLLSRTTRVEARRATERSLAFGGADAHLAALHQALQIVHLFVIFFRFRFA